MPSISKTLALLAVCALAQAEVAPEPNKVVDAAAPTPTQFKLSELLASQPMPTVAARHAPLYNPDAAHDVDRRGPFDSLTSGVVAAFSSITSVAVSGASSVASVATSGAVSVASVATSGAVSVATSIADVLNPFDGSSTSSAGATAAAASGTSAASGLTVSAVAVAFIASAASMIVFA